MRRETPLRYYSFFKIPLYGGVAGRAWRGGRSFVFFF